MSRLGKQPITIPAGVTVTYDQHVFTMQGPKGSLTRRFTDDVAIAIQDTVVTLSPNPKSDRSAALWGTYAAHIHNMLKGVTEGYTKKLAIEGVGYRAEVKGNDLSLLVGFSHPVDIAIPEGITVNVEKGLITIEGIDKDVVGQFAAVVRATKKPEPYKGKGIRYEGEYIIRKQGKRAVA